MVNEDIGHICKIIISGGSEKNLRVLQSLGINCEIFLPRKLKNMHRSRIFPIRVAII